MGPAVRDIHRGVRHLAAGDCSARWRSGSPKSAADAAAPATRSPTAASPPIAAIVALTTPYTAPALVALVAALTAGGSDTVASEIGKAWGRSTFLVTTFSRVTPGTPGAMSLEGTAAGILAALALAAIGVAFGLVPASAIFAIVAGATVGALVESALGATLEGPGILNNDMLNFINTAVAAAWRWRSRDAGTAER